MARSLKCSRTSSVHRSVVARPLSDTRSGSGPVAAFVYGMLPLAAPQWVAYGLSRWEMNIRMATVLGFVGAGGLGQLLYFHLSLFQQAQSATVLAAMFVLVFLVDGFSGWARRRLAPAHA